MNRRQVWVACVGLAVTAGMLVFRPWQVEAYVPPSRAKMSVTSVLDVEISTVYDWCWKPVGECPGERYPQPDRLWPRRYHDDRLLLLQVVAWGCLVLVAFRMARSAHRRAQKLDRNE